VADSEVSPSPDEKPSWWARWGDAGRIGKLIADADSQGRIVSVGGDGGWIANWVEDPQIGNEWEQCAACGIWYNTDPIDPDGRGGLCNNCITEGQL
jgi:hypothetical protein